MALMNKTAHDQATRIALDALDRAKREYSADKIEAWAKVAQAAASLANATKG